MRMATFSIRLDARIASAVDRIAAKTGKTKSQIVREALAEYTEKADKNSGSERPYDKMAPFIGILDSGGMQLSTDGGKKVAQMLLEERDARRRADR
jgi:Ribbon-helix-helix protein, copG family